MADAMASNAVMAPNVRKQLLRGPVIKLRKHLDYGRRHQRAIDACCSNDGSLLVTLARLLGMDAKAAPLDSAIGLLKDIAFGLASSDRGLQEPGAAVAVRVAALAKETKGKEQLKRLAIQDRKSSKHRAAEARALLLSKLTA